MSIMRFEYRCNKCDTVSDWHIDTNGRISEFVCKQCGVHIGYSDGLGVKLYGPVPDPVENRYRFLEDEIIPRTTVDFDTGTYTSTGASTAYPHGTGGRYW